MAKPTTVQKDGDAPSGQAGRPRNNEPGSSVCAWMRASDHDRLIKMAMQRRTSVSSLVREIIVLTLR